MSKLLSLTFSSIALILPVSLSAEIHQCDGQWTNKPCEGRVEREIKETHTRAGAIAPVTTQPESAPEVSEPLAPRYDLIRKLKKTNKEYQDQKKIALSKTEIDGFEAMCLQRTTSYSDCLKEFNDKNHKLTELNQNQERNDLEAERNKIEASKVPGLHTK